jgi:hypothetical protein
MLPGARVTDTHLCARLSATDLYLLLVAIGKAAELRITYPQILALYRSQAEGMARIPMCAECPFRASTEVPIGVPDWPQTTIPIRKDDNS